MVGLALVTNVGKVCTCLPTPAGDGAAGSRGTVVVEARGRTRECSVDDFEITGSV